MKWLAILLFPITAFGQNQQEIQQEYLKLVNQFRAENRLPAVNLYDDANKTAKIQSDYIASTTKVDGNSATAELTHSHPAYPMPADRFAFVNPADDGKFLVYEICAGNWTKDTLNYKQLALDAFNAWKESPGHRAILLNPIVSLTGISISFKKVVIKTPEYRVNPNTMSFERAGFKDNVTISVSATSIFLAKI